MIKRYTKLDITIPYLSKDIQWKVFEAKMSEDKEGQWVKYEDVKDLLWANDDLPESVWFARYPKEKKEKCNCQKKLDEALTITHNQLKDMLNNGRLYPIPDQEWVCPVHGYKKR